MLYVSNVLKKQINQSYNVCMKLFRPGKQDTTEKVLMVFQEKCQPDQPKWPKSIIKHVSIHNAIKSEYRK